MNQEEDDDEENRGENMEALGDGNQAITLIVKTPNQKIDDIEVDCLLTWTVEKLKNHLSSVYPTKPERSSQRLIYSGRLLLDHLVLKDFLRQYEAGERQTVHLVCASLPDAQSSPSNTSVSSVSSTSSASSSSLNQTTTQPTTTAFNDGLRFRGTQAQPNFPQYNMPMYNNNMFMGQTPQMFPGTQGGYMMPPPPPNMMIWMQQMQEMMRLQMAGGRVPMVPPFMMPPNMQYPYYAQNMQQPQVPVTTPPSPPPQPPQQVPQPRPPQQANQNVRMNAAGGGPVMDDDDDDEHLNRDWLDWIYMLCRVGILLSVFWFYSSPGRFIIVLGCMLVIYLIQTGRLGWFRDRNRQREVIQLPAENVHPGEAQQEQDQNAEGENANNDGNGDSSDSNGAETSPVQPAQPPQPSFVSVAYNFVVTFFTSLIPQGPPPIQ